MNQSEVFAYIHSRWEAFDSSNTPSFFLNSIGYIDCEDGSRGCIDCALSKSYNFNGGCLTGFKETHSKKYQELYPEDFL